MVLFEIRRPRFSRFSGQKAKQVARLRELHGLLLRTYRQERRFDRALRGKALAPRQMREAMAQLLESYAALRQHAPVFTRLLNVWKPEEWLKHQPAAEEFLRPDAAMEMSRGLGPAHALYYAHTKRAEPAVLLELHQRDLRLAPAELGRRTERFSKQSSQLMQEYRRLEGEIAESEITEFELDHPYAKRLNRLHSRSADLFLEGTLILKARRHLAEAGQGDAGRAELDRQVAEAVLQMRQQVAQNLERTWHPGALAQQIFRARRKQIQDVQAYLKGAGG